MRHRAGPALIAALILHACVATPAAPPGKPTAPGMNAFRAQNNLPPLQRSARADAAARAHAADMARNGFFSHRGSDGSRFDQRLRAAGCAPYGAENIAQGQPSFAAAMAGWIASAGHRRNILNRDVTFYGWAEVERHWVMVFTAAC